MPVPDIDAARVEKLLCAAVAAPSIHNSQPWRFRLDPRTPAVEVRAAPQRRLPLADPALRAVHLSVGAAVFNLRVAAGHLGWAPEVRLLPDAQDPDLLARVLLTDPDAQGPVMPALYEAIARRRTSRLPFTGRPVPEQIIAEMASGVRVEGGRLHVPDVVETRRMLRLTAEAEQRNQADWRRTAESRAWVVPRDSGPFGVPVDALGPADAARRIPMRDFTGIPVRFPAPRPVRFERHAQLALLWTREDGPEDWLRAGQGLERALLLATARGVRTSALYQALEWPDLREQLVRRPRRCPQFLIRFGYGPEGAPTPRARALVASARARRAS
ncbi:Acg family FMN-binding oxidoreductase [Streptomyces gamaensis]|uniref:Acg family FMN-binding oxidoreductase n=1 Tax=Streptomyces gamaensis TaxID=1763542 RepID=A0ABW0YWF0_9ACTN